MDEVEFEALAQRLDRSSTWGRSDEQGALNFLTQATALGGVATVRTGEVIVCADPARARNAVAGGPVAINTTTESGPTWLAVNETVTFPQHGAHSMTHLDALGHFLYEGRGHAGFGNDAITSTGVLAQDITSAAEGVVSRGVLLDLARIRGTPYLAPNALVSLKELVAWCERTSTEPMPGDVMFVRTGRPNAPPSNDSEYPAVGGIDLECAAWFHEWRCSVVVSDAGLDTTTTMPCPTVPTPWHVLTLARMGVRLVDMADLERLGDACEREQRVTFLAVLAPLPLAGATASPVNPIAVL